MRAVRITGPRRFAIEDVPEPSPGPAQVRIRLEGCGVCGSNLPVWQGRPWLNYPFEAGAPGHEGWGIVDLLGDGVQGLHAGERVALLSYHAYAEYDLAEADQVVRVPPQTEVFPGEALGCAINIFQRSDVQAGQTVAILGVGFLGALLTQLCTAAGARVIVLSRRQFALAVGRPRAPRKRSIFGTPAPPRESTSLRTVEDASASSKRRVTGDSGSRRGDYRRPRPSHHRRLPSGFTAPGEYAIMELAGYRRRQRARA